MTNQQTQTMERVIGTHERLEAWAKENVEFMVELNEAIKEITGNHSDRVNQLLDDYFAITSTAAAEADQARSTSD